MTDTTAERMCCNCEKPATHDFLDDEGEVHHLCTTCHNAFLLGQQNYGYRTAVVNGIELCGKCRTAIFLDQDEFERDPATPSKIYCRACSKVLSRPRRTILDLGGINRHRSRGYPEDAPGGISLEQMYEARTDLGD